MESSKLAFKFFAEDPSSLAVADVVPVFHSWIQTHAVPEHLLIDVADYQHVVDGPGTVLVSHEANFYADREDGRAGLLYVRKQPLPGSLGERMRVVLQATLEGCARLEAHPRLKGKMRFRTDEFVFRVNDRLLAPNTPETFDAVRPELERLILDTYGGAPAGLEHRTSPQALFEVRVKTTGQPDVASLLSRLGAAVVAV